MRLSKDRPVCSPSRFCCRALQRGSSPGLEGWPEWGTHPSSCPGFWRCSAQSRHTPAHSSLPRGKKPHPKTGNAPVLPCPRSETAMRILQCCIICISRAVLLEINKQTKNFEGCQDGDTWSWNNNTLKCII